MMAADRLTVAIISPEATVFEGEADMVVAPAWDGEVGVLRGHAPMLVLLGAGVMRIKLEGAPMQRFNIAGGFMQVTDDVVTVLSERASTA
jgi:F-type H+-transporting ATPase subunit epsilon